MSKKPYVTVYYKEIGKKEYESKEDWFDCDLNPNYHYHRLDGPALEFANGGRGYYVNDKHFTKEDYYNHPEVINHLNNKPAQSTNTCNHKWKLYQGFTESYEYCEVCDMKRS